MVTGSSLLPYRDTGEPAPNGALGVRRDGRLRFWIAVAVFVHATGVMFTFGSRVLAEPVVLRDSFLLWILFYLLALGMLLRDAGRHPLGALRPPYLIAYGALAFISVYWSVNPSVTTNRAFA